MIALGTLFSIVFGTITGVLSAWRRDTALDKTGLYTALGFYSMPTQWLGLLMVLFVAGWLGLPTSGIRDPTLGILSEPSCTTVAVDRLKHMILPALTLGLVLYGDYALIMRSAMLETLGEDYVLTARAKGLRNFGIVRKHGFRNALLPIVTLIALSLGFIIGGAITIEYVFSYPGIGLATVEAIDQRDWPLLQAIFLLLTLLGDLLQPHRGPALREARPAGGGSMSVTPPTTLDRRPPPGDKGVPERPRLAFLRSSVFRKPATLVGLAIILLFVLIAIFAPQLEPYNPRSKTGAVYAPPSSAHWLGTDDAGADMLSLVIAGARVSLIVGFAAAFVAMVIGGAVGLFSGFFGGKTDQVLMRITDYVLVIPDIPLMIIIAALFGRSCGTSSSSSGSSTGPAPPGWSARR